MAGGFPIMRAYRPSSIQNTVRFAPAPATTVFRPVFLNTKSQREAWIEENKTWSRTIARTIEQRQQRRLEVEKAQDRAKCRTILHQQQEAQEKAQTEYDTQMAELSFTKGMWSTSCTGLAVSGVLFLTLLTNLLRDTKGGLLGGNTTCDLVHSLTDSSKFSVVFWIAVVVQLISRIVVSMAVANLAALSEVLGRDDAAYYRHQSESLVFMYTAGPIWGDIMLLRAFTLMVGGKCDGEDCLNLALGTLAVMSWAMLVSIAGILFLEIGYRVVVGQDEEQREEAIQSGWALLSQEEKDTFEWV